MDDPTLNICFCLVDCGHVEDETPREEGPGEAGGSERTALQDP